jgi:internalin A
MSRLALQLIDEAYEKKSSFLDLGNCSLRSIPKEITKLSDSLESLNLGGWFFYNGQYQRSNNNLSYNSFYEAEPLKNLTKLKKLNKLWLRSCRIEKDNISFIDKMHSLELLDLSFNEIGELGVKLISKHTSLNHLDLTFGRIGESSAEYLANLKSLTHLILDTNELTSESLKHLRNLKNLTHLNLYNNAIDDKGVLFLNNDLPSLTYLDIAFNKISTEGAMHLSKLPALMTLNISSNNLNDDSANYISKISTLTDLEISGNQITHKGAEYISKIPSLKKLDLGENQIGPIGAKAISKIHTLTDLNLAGNKIGPGGAEEISRLVSLTSLNINENLLGNEGAQYISRLSKLTYLNIENNSLNDIAVKSLSEISTLKNLDISNNNITDQGIEYIQSIPFTQLYLENNQIGDRGVELICKNPSLEYLNISNNNIGNKGVEYITNLPALRGLVLNSNNIDEDGAAKLGSLTALTSLHLQNNKIRKIPLNLIKNIPLEIELEERRYYHSGDIYLFGNPIEYPPQEVLKQGRLAVLEYLEEAQQPLNECKLIFVGDGSVGKTSLMKRLVDGIFDKSEKTTHGINKIVWKDLMNEQGEAIKVNLWDFGGQHIQHSLHQFFFTERVVYVLVLNPRNDEKAHYWLDQIEKLGRGSQIIIAYNWKDEKDKEASYLNNFFELRKIYPKLSEPVLLSCATGDGMDEFEIKVKRAILSNDGLKTKYPIKWFEIKEKLEKEIPIETNYIEYSLYEKWCQEKEYNDPDRRKNLLKILDSVGAIVFFDRPILNQLQVLNPEWITTGAYAILTAEKTKETKGHISWNDLKDIFKDEKEIFSDRKVKIKYGDSQFQFIIQLMLDYRLCQKNPLKDHEYLIPSAFGERPNKDYEKEKKDSRHYRLQFESSFEMLIMHRFIAKNIIHIVGKDYWNSGMFFKHSTSETYALVDTNLYSRQIDCWIKGENIRGLWEVIRSDFREIFKMYHNFPVKEEVEYSTDNRIVFLPYQEMLDSLKNGIFIIEYHPTYQLKKIDVQNVLELFESPEQTNRVINNEKIRIEVNPEIVIKPEIKTEIKSEITSEIKNSTQTLFNLQNLSKMKKNNPWISGSFYLISAVIILSLLLVAAKIISPIALPIVIIGGLIIFSVIGAYQLRNDDKLSDKSFLQLMGLSFRQIPFIRSNKK